jgi:Protein of unknown function (DUF3024)
MAAWPPADFPSSTSPRVQRWCAEQVPAHARGEIRIECDLAPRHLTICECRPPWREDYGPDWTRFPIAGLHYTKTTGLWTLYWRDRNLKYHRYEPLDPSPKSKTCSTTSTTEPTPSSGDNDRLT